MKIYEIATSSCFCNGHSSTSASVVAESIDQAQRIFLKKYPNAEIIGIEKRSDYVVMNDERGDVEPEQ